MDKILNYFKGVVNKSNNSPKFRITKRCDIDVILMEREIKYDLEIRQNLSWKLVKTDLPSLEKVKEYKEKYIQYIKETENNYIYDQP